MPEQSSESPSQPTGNIEDIFESVQPDLSADPGLGVVREIGQADGAAASQAEPPTRTISKTALALIILALLALAAIAGFFFIPSWKNTVSAAAGAAKGKLGQLAEFLPGGKNNVGQGSAETKCSDETKKCPDGTLIKRSGPGCKFAECPFQETSTTTPGSSDNGFGKEASDVDQEFFRDSKRLSDIAMIRNALKRYRAKTGSYPEKLVFGSNLVTDKGVSVAFVPRSPKPGGEEYEYRSFASDAFALIFVLEKGVKGVGLGKNVALELGEYPAVDTDSDGLFDKEEMMYGTDVRKKDSDNDKYGDMEELAKGYNPAGPGLYARKRNN